MTDIAFSPFFASGALRFAFEKATTEGKMTICALFVLSLFSWTVIISKSRQLYRASDRPSSNKASCKQRAARSIFSSSTR